MNLPSLLDTGVPRRLVVGGLVGTTLLACGAAGAGAVPKKGTDANAQVLRPSRLQQDNATRKP